MIVIHVFHSSKDINLPLSQELVEELGIYFLLFDRAGYGQSDPHPSRSMKSEAYDIQELADKMLYLLHIVLSPVILNMRWHWNGAYYKKEQTKHRVDCLRVGVWLHDSTSHPKQQKGEQNSDIASNRYHTLRVETMN
ncbi:unnamed protein product [Lupinus luteus]|uniref:AB hydrolase-1 domain-containing protein n=1 Tax=Lupinus luteus TaxID=3873 RepID=A0AAV1XLZ8_LUPLU